MGDGQRFETIIRVVIAVLFVAILGIGGFFGWTVYRDRRAAEDASPAMRIVRVIEQEVRSNPNDAMLRVRLGEAYAAAGREQDAIEQFNAALKIDPKHTGALLDLGQLAMINGRYGTAEGYYQKILEVTQESEFAATSDRREIALYQLGLIALNGKGYEDAIGFFKAALRIRKDASDTYYYLALAMDGAGQQDGAIEQLRIALAFDPNFGQAHYYLGQLYLRRDDKVLASRHFGLAAKADPDAEEPKEALAQFGDPDTLMTKARELQSRDASAALDAATIARNISPGDIRAIVLHAEVLESTGDLNAALEAYREALKLDSDDARLKAAVARLEKSAGDEVRK